MESGVSIESVCGAAGKCAKCKVVVREGDAALAPATQQELRTLTSRELSSGTRLACQARVAKPARIVVEVPESSRRGHHRLLASGVEPAVRLSPAVTKVVLTIPPATLRDVRADDDRLLDVLYKKARLRSRLSHGVHRKLPDALREGNWTTTLTLFAKSEIIRVDPGDTSGELHGVAVDIGTTKVVAYLINLSDGKVLATESMPNPQIPYGEDLMSRISYTIRHNDGMEILRKAIVDGLNSLINKLCAQAGIEPTDILQVMIVGNTAMHHIFFGIPARHLASAPYAPAVRTSLSLPAGEAGVDIYPFGKVTSLPNVAGFVGADAVADLLSSRLYKDKTLGMMIDIGTNTEIIAGNSDRLISCSCASGPAFEGAHISFGMRAATGAIERVWIDPNTAEVRVTTVDDAPPKGICGSGIVDAISEMFKAGILDDTGKLVLDSGCDRIRRTDSGPAEFVLVWGSELEGGKDITISQKDIQEIQLAKAAIYTGVAILLRKLRAKPQDIRRVYAAGAFGTYVDAGAAVNIGMYPDVPLDRIRFIGNAAGSGARMALRSTKVADLAEELSRKIEYVELAAEKDFQTEYAKAMFLPHRDIDRFPTVRARLLSRKG